MAYLSVRELVKTYGEVTAANRVSFDLRQGHFLCLLGPSGCGKTTTLRMLAGLVAQDSGDIIVGGAEISRLPTHKRKIGMVFQNWALFPHLTVFENVAFGLRLQRLGAHEITERVTEALEAVQLPSMGGRRPAQLSGGQQQRVALARSLVTRPQLMLFDEPLSNLDLKLRHEMRTEIKRLHEELDLTAVFVTHDQGEALSLGDVVAVMRNGEIVEMAPPSQLFGRPRTTYVADFLGVENLLRGQLTDGGQKFRTLEGIEILLAKEAGEPAGRGGAVGIRAENVTVLVESPPPGPNTFSGVVRDIDFQGSRVVVTVELNGSSTLLYTTSGASLRLERGNDVYLTFLPEHAQVLEDNL